MIRFDSTRYGDIFDLYKRHEFFFPLIGSVLLNEQDGIVYVDNFDKPEAVYIEHVFGFAQIFGTPSEGFMLNLERYLLIEKPFEPDKIRLYTPFHPDFMNIAKWDSLRSIRQRFATSPDIYPAGQPVKVTHDEHVEIVSVDERNVQEVDRIFGVVGRFWRSPEDFIKHAKATVVLRHSHIAAICYAAAVADSRVEIDVLTLPEFRAQGLGKLAVKYFIEQCKESSLQPLWDCFTNNAGSMQLAQSAGFKVVDPPYAFYTISG